MRNRVAGAALGAVLILAPALCAQDNVWTISPLDSFANFTVKHLMISSVHGTAGGMKGKVVYDPTDPSKDSVVATIDAGTISTGIAKRDEQVKTDYFQVAKYPLISFRSEKVTQTSPGHLSMTGNLTIKDITRPVVLEIDGPSRMVKDAQGRSKVGITATTKISRKDFGIVGTALDSAMEAGGIIVSDEVQIELDMEMTPGAVAPPTGPAKPK